MRRSMYSSAIRCMQRWGETRASARSTTTILEAAARDIDGDTLTFSASGLADGITIGSASGQFSGTIAAGADSGSPYHVTVTVSDGQASASKSFDWAVKPFVVERPNDQHNAS